MKQIALAGLFVIVFLVPATGQDNQLSCSYLALGDSYTIGEAVTVSERYPVQLKDSLTRYGIYMAPPVIVARTGWTTGELLDSLSRIELDRDFDLVTLLIGVNNQYRGLDIGHYEKEFVFLLEKAVHYAGGDHSRVVVLSIPDWGVTPFARERDPHRIAKEIDRFNMVNRERTEALDIRYVNVTPVSREAAKDPSLLAKDGLHPSGSMYAMWVELLVPEVVQLLEKNRCHDY